MNLISKNFYESLKRRGYSVRFAFHPQTDILEVVLGRPGCEMTRHFRIEDIDWGSSGDFEKTFQAKLHDMLADVNIYDREIQKFMRAL